MTAIVRNISADFRILAGALVVIVVLAVVAVIFGPAPPAPPLSVRNDDRNGAMALRRWLERSGYNVVEALGTPSNLDQLDVLFVLDPVIFYGEDDGTRIKRWVENGNTLIITGAPYNVNALLSSYDMALRYIWPGEPVLSPAAPTLNAPPLKTLQVDAFYGIETERPGVVVHLSTETMPILVSFNEGNGRVWVSGSLRPFTNRGLQDEGSPGLIQNMLASVPLTATIGFDERGHGYGETPQTVSAWLFGTSPGWGVLSGLIITMTYLAFRGRRFGKAVPLPDERLRREPVEYIQAMANLFRRSGQRAEVLRHYNQQLRRRLSERYALDPKLNDVELIKTVVFHDPDVDETVLRDLLKRLSHQKISEQELITIASDVDHLLRSME